MREILVTTEEFKDSPVGIIPKDWNFKALSELADVDRGKFIYRPRNDPRLYGGSYPFIQTGDIASASGGILTTYSQTLNERGISVSRQFPIGTIAITIAANIADTAILGIPMYFPDSVVGAVVKKPNSIRYVELCIHRAKQKLEARAPQSAQKNINLEDLRPLLIPVPSTEEQQKIAEIIDTIDKAIALTDTHITKLKKAKAGLLHDLLTRGIDEYGELRDYTRNPELFKRSALGIIPKDWQTPTIDEIRVDDAPICYGIVQTGSNIESGIPVLAIYNMGGDYRTHIHRTSQLIENRYIRSRVKPNDVLISVKGTIGRVDVVPNHFFGNISRDIARIRLKSYALPKYVFQTLSSQIFQLQIVRTAVGTTRAEISIWILKQLRLPLPPIEEQERIMNYLDIHNCRIFSKEARLKKLKLLKKGLMSDLLTGRVRVKI